MRERNRSGRAGRRRSGGDGEQDLFTKQLSKIVEHAFATTDTEAKPREAAPEAPVENQVVLPPLDIPDAQAEAVAPQDAELGTMSAVGSKPASSGRFKTSHCCWFSLS